MALTMIMSDYIDINELKSDELVQQLYTLPDDQVDLTADADAAEAEVNGYIAKRYAVPVTDQTAIKLLRRFAEALFREMAYTLRGAGSEIPEKIKRAADVTRKQLKDIAGGVMSLGVEDITENTDGASGLLVSGNDPEFTRDDLEGF